MYIHVLTYTYIYIHVHTYTCIYIHKHTHIHIHTYPYTCIYIPIHTDTYIYIHIHTHTYIQMHTHIQMYSYAYIWPSMYTATSKLYGRSCRIVIHVQVNGHFQQSRACSATEDRTRCYVSNAVVKRRSSVALYGKVPQPKEIRRWAQEETASSAAIHEIAIVHVPNCCCHVVVHVAKISLVCPGAPDEGPDACPHACGDECPHACPVAGQHNYCYEMPVYVMGMFCLCT